MITNNSKTEELKDPVDLAKLFKALRFKSNFCRTCGERIWLIGRDDSCQAIVDSRGFSHDECTVDPGTRRGVFLQGFLNVTWSHCRYCLAPVDFVQRPRYDITVMTERGRISSIHDCTWRQMRSARATLIAKVVVCAAFCLASIAALYFVGQAR